MSRCRNVLRLLGAILVGGAVFVGAPSEAQATFVLSLQSGATTLNVVDNGAGDTNPLAGAINLNSTVVGDFTLSGTIATSNNGHLLQNPTITINNLSVLAVTSGTLKITVYDDSFTTTSPGNATVRNSISATSPDDMGTGTVTYMSVVAGQGSPTLTVPADLGATSGTYVVTLPAMPAGFTVRSVTTINAASAGQYQLTGGTTVRTPQGGPLPSPAPAGLALALTGAPFLALGWVRRRLRA